MPAKKIVFVSHIAEDASVAEWLKATLNRDFLELFEVFVSSDTESIAAGEEWLPSVRKALQEFHDSDHPKPRCASLRTAIYGPRRPGPV